MKAGGEFAESHRRVGLDDLEALVGDFLLELGFDGLGLPAVGSPGGRLMADAIVAATPGKKRREESRRAGLWEGERVTRAFLFAREAHNC